MIVGLAERVIVGFAAVPFNEGTVIPLSYAVEFWSDLVVGGPTDQIIGVATEIGADILAGADANMWVATMTALESTSMLASPKGILLFGWKACS